MGIGDLLFKNGKNLARAGYVFLALGLGLCFTLQRDVVVGGRDVLERLPIPFWGYGIFLLILAGFKVAAMVRDDGRIMARCMVTSTFFWIGLGAGFGAAAAIDPVHVPFSGMVVFWFIALMHMVGAGIEASRGVISRG